MANTLRRTAIKVINKQKVLRSVVIRQKNDMTEPNILKSCYKDIPITNYTINDFVWQNLDRWPDKTVTICAVTGRGYTFAQSHRMSIAFAASLVKKLKLGNGDKVAIILPNVPEYPAIMLGILEAGCVASTMNPVYTAHELKHHLEKIDCKAIVTSQVSYANIANAISGMKAKIPIIMIDNDNLPEGTIKFSELAEDRNIDTDCLKTIRRNPDDVALLPFSSGTTGLPKGVVLSHRSIVAMNHMIADPEIVAIKETTATYQSVMPAVLPFFHIFGLNVLMLNQMYLGCKLVTLPYFKPDLFLNTIVSHKANVLFVVPPMLIFLGKHPAVTSAHLEPVHAIVSGAAAVSEADAAAVLNKNKQINFRQGFGLTETNGVVSTARKTDTNHASVGHVVGSCELKIADIQTQEALGPGKEGEIWFRGPNLMQGYYEDETANKNVFTEDGWYKTGDIGKYDENGYIYMTDRMKELIKVKGFQVPPAELEAIIRSHPKVADCAVLGVPDPVSGEVPKAFLVTQPGQTLQPEEIKEFVNNKVAAFKKIKYVQFVEAIPKNPAGKTLRKVLKEKYC